MMGRFSLNLLGRVQGVYVLGLAALGSLVLLSLTLISERLMLCGFGLILLLILAVCWRVVRGGDQGTTDLEITRDGVRMTNIRLGVSTLVLQRALGVYLEQQQVQLPMPKPVGVVTGNPSAEDAVIALSSAELPQNVPVAEEPLQIPRDAQGLSVNLRDNVTVTDEQGKAPVEIVEPR